MPETEIIDKLFLELAQFTTAKTNREAKYETMLSIVLKTLIRIKNKSDDEKKIGINSLIIILTEEGITRE